MPKISLAGFKDPVRRPRWILWSGSLVLVLAAIVITALGVTSTYWFCSSACHKVQDDTIIAYDNSSHAEVSCMACHMPVNANPVTFVLHKMKALGEAYLTISNKFELPLNHGSHLALGTHMPEEQCTQCHNLENRDVTPSDGVKINHAVHAERGIACSWCHNRVAHPENFELTLAHPETGEPNQKHDDFMEMTACFRCHGLAGDADAPGACGKCHPADFQLKPPSHFENDFYPRGHADLALEDLGLAEPAEGEVREASSEETATESDEATDTEAEETTEAEEGAEEPESEEAAEGEEEEDLGPVPDENGSYEGLGLGLPKVEDVSYCGTCHVVDQFCMNCHGMEMPHSEEFETRQHPEVAAAQFDKCVLCHNPEATFFCAKCHHGTQVDWTFDPAEPWQTQHAKNVSSAGVSKCLEACHDVKFCNDCHTAENPFPSSHQQADWLHRASFEERAKHSEAATGEITACEVCHGEGGTEAAFCKNCHEFEMPHEDEFKERHAATGKANESQCAYCHRFGPVCSTCHHFGITTPFIQAHPATVAEQGTDACFESCHEKQSCIDCHTKLEAVPTSHRPADFVRLFGEESAKHVVAYEDSEESCTYCHGDGGPEASFCMNCHGMIMPHPSGFGAEDDGGLHQSGLASGELNKDRCENCHQATFCNACHHEEATGSKPWLNEHPDIVKADGATGCFECHEETQCSYCHVRLVSGFE